jgi:hypothetical protein
MMAVFGEVKPSLKLVVMPSSAALPQFFVVIATLKRSHMTRGAKLKPELLSEAAIPSIVTGNFERSDDRFCAFRMFPK